MFAFGSRAHAGFGEAGDDALFRSILLPMLTWTAERCGGFDWNDEAFDAAPEALELLEPGPLPIETICSSPIAARSLSVW